MVYESVCDPMRLPPDTLRGKAASFGYRSACRILDSALHLDTMKSLRPEQMPHDRPSASGRETEPVADFGIAVLPVDVPADRSACQLAPIPDPEVEPVASHFLLLEPIDEGFDVVERMDSSRPAKPLVEVTPALSHERMHSASIRGSQRSRDCAVS
jgi:hypothetical protein